MNQHQILRALIVPVFGLSLLASRLEAVPEDAGAHKTINVNQASASELERLPRVGPKLAERIVSHRSQNGPFRRIEDLMEVKGVGEKTFSLLRPYLAVSGPTTLAEKVAGRRSSKPPASKKASEAARSATTTSNH